MPKFIVKPYISFHTKWDKYEIEGLRVSCFEGSGRFGVFGCRELWNPALA